MWFKKLIKKLWIYIKPFLNWRFLVSYFIPFMIVNGWAWIGVYLLPFIGFNWYTEASLAWQAILWMPWTPEKLLTIPVALWIHKLLFKKSNKDMEIMLVEAKKDWRNIKRKLMRNKVTFIEITEEKKEKHLCGMCGKPAKIKIKGCVDGMFIRGYACEDCFKDIIKDNLKYEKINQTINKEI